MARQNAEIKNFDDLPVILGAPLVAQVLGLSLPLVYQLFSSDGFPVIQLSEKRRVVTKAAFKSWLESKGQSEQAGIVAIKEQR